MMVGLFFYIGDRLSCHDVVYDDCLALSHLVMVCEMILIVLLVLKLWLGEGFDSVIFVVINTNNVLIEGLCDGYEELHMELIIFIVSLSFLVWDFVWDLSPSFLLR
jgi:hypothetical protein